MAAHFYGNDAPVILTREMLQSKDNMIKVVADISCDVDGPIACTIKASTIAEPFLAIFLWKTKKLMFFILPQL